MEILGLVYLLQILDFWNILKQSSVLKLTFHFELFDGVHSFKVSCSEQ